jgi:hypothetical protein
VVACVGRGVVVGGAMVVGFLHVLCSHTRPETQVQHGSLLHAIPSVLRGQVVVVCVGRGVVVGGGAVAGFLHVLCSHTRPETQVQHGSLLHAIPSVLRGQVVGGSVVGVSVVGGSVVGSSVVGDSVVGDSVVGDSVVGDSVVSGGVVGGSVVGGRVVGGEVVGSVVQILCSHTRPEAQVQHGSVLHAIPTALGGQRVADALLICCRPTANNRTANAPKVTFMVGAAGAASGLVVAAK